MKKYIRFQRVKSLLSREGYAILVLTKLFLSIFMATLFGLTLSQILKQKKIRAQTLAYKAGVTPICLSRNMNGKLTPPTTEFVDTICDILNVTGELRERLQQEAAISYRKVYIPKSATADQHTFVHQLLKKLESLPDAHLQIMNNVMHLSESPIPKKGPSL